MFLIGGLCDLCYNVLKLLVAFALMDLCGKE